MDALMMNHNHLSHVKHLFAFQLRDTFLDNYDRTNNVNSHNMFVA